MERIHKNRQIRVFISSTFRDMQEERDYLVKFIFPQLHKLCESRGVTWGEVDLRWGVPDEQAAEGKVLPICLEEIRRCRPYFIGLLGERYGWVPDSIPEQLLEKEPWLREQAEGRKSVTELEILHGVLRDPEMAGHAYFYFRDPAYIETVPPDKYPDFTCEDAESAKKLAQLKQQIREQNFPVRENYPTPDALGELVLADMTAAINRLYPAGSQPDPVDQETMDHEAYAASLARVYICRESYFQRLDEHADSGSHQPLVILGEPGSGKSALLANWARHYCRNHPDTPVIQHYIGASLYSSDWAATVRHIMGEFKRVFNIQRKIPNAPEELRRELMNWLHMGADTGKCILILDALDQLEDKDGALDLIWLPSFIPSNIRLIVSTHPGRPLNDLKRRGWPTLTVELLEERERREQLVVEYLARHSKALPISFLQMIIDSEQTKNPLFLTALLNELRLFGSHEQLAEHIRYYLGAGTIEELYERILSRYERDYEQHYSGLVQEAFSLIWASRTGLSETELLGILGQQGIPLPRSAWSPLFLGADQSFINLSGLITFSHPYLRHAVMNRYLSSEDMKKDTHRRLADYFQKQELEPRAIKESLWQLTKLNDWKRLNELLTNAQIFTVLAAEPQHFELVKYWLRIKDMYDIAQECTKCIECYERTDPGAEQLSFIMVQMAKLLCLLSDNGAAALFGRALQVCKQCLSEGHPLILECLTGLARVYELKTDYESAVHCLEQALDIVDRTGGANQPGTFEIIDEAANLFIKKQDFRKAEHLYRQMLASKRETLDPRDLSTAITMNNLAVLLEESAEHRATGILDEVQMLYYESCKIVQHVLGPNHPLTAAILANAAKVCYRKQEYKTAESLYRRALEIRELVLDKKHPDIITSLAELADVLTKTGEHINANILSMRIESLQKEAGYTSSVLGSRMGYRFDRIDHFGETAILYKEMRRLNTEVKHRSDPVTHSICDLWIEYFETHSGHCRGLIVEHYLYFVAVIARRLFKSLTATQAEQFSLSDFMKAGISGLTAAIEHYDPSNGVKFETFSSWWIKQSIERAYQLRKEANEAHAL